MCLFNKGNAAAKAKKARKNARKATKQAATVPNVMDQESATVKDTNKRSASALALGTKRYSSSQN